MFKKEVALNKCKYTKCKTIGYSQLHIMFTHSIFKNFAKMIAKENNLFVLFLFNYN